MTVSLLGSSSFFYLFISGVADDGEPEGLLSFHKFFSCVKDDDNKPPNSSSSFGFFPQMENMTMSWEAPGSLSSLGFFLKCELIGCITT